MSLRIRRGTDAQRETIIFDMGELVYTTDTKKLYIGDGITVGGVNVLAQMAGNSVVYNAVTQQLDFNASGLSTSTITEGTNKYFTAQRAQDAVGTLISNGTQTGVTITYDSNAHSLSFNVTGAGTLTSVSGDTNPSLGGNLNLSSHNITGTGTINITGNITANSGTITGDTVIASILETSRITINGSNITNPSGTPSYDPTFLDSSSGQYIRVHTTGGVFEIKAVVNNSQPTSNNTLQHYVSRGTVASPAIVHTGDSLGGSIHLAYDGTTFVYTGSSNFIVDPRFTPASSSVKALYTIGFPDRNSPADTNFYADSLGVFSVPVGIRLTPLANPTARNAAFPAGSLYAGMMVFLSDITGSSGGPGLQINLDGTSGGWKTISHS